MKNVAHQSGHAVLVALISLIGLVLSALISRGYFDGTEETQAALTTSEAASAAESAQTAEEAASEAASAASDASESEDGAEKTAAN